MFLSGASACVGGVLALSQTAGAPMGLIAVSKSSCRYFVSSSRRGASGVIRGSLSRGLLRVLFGNGGGSKRGTRRASVIGTRTGVVRVLGIVGGASVSIISTSRNWG